MKLNLIIISILLSIFILVVSTLVVVNDFGFYKKEASKNEVYSSFQDREYVNNIYNNLINYFHSNDNLLDIYNYREITHLKDVKNVILYLNVLFYILLIILLFLIYKNYENIDSILLYSFIFIISLTFILILFTLFNFDFLFDKFHKMFFNDNSWIFDNDSIIIKLFPKGFFIDSLLRILELSIFFILSLFFSNYCIGK